VDLISCDILSIDFEFHTLIAVSTSLCHDHAKNSQNRVRTEFLRSTADLLYEVINRRYERKSLIVTTNRPFKEWNEVFPNATCIATLLDRLLHHADVTLIEGDSYRVRESEQEAAARRRKK